MSNIINDENNNHLKLLQLILRVEENINNFQEEYELVHRSLNNMQMVHNKIIASYQTLGEAYWQLVTKLDSTECSTKVCNIDDNDDEIVAQSPIKKKVKGSQKHITTSQTRKNDETYCAWAEEKGEKVDKNNTSNFSEKNKVKIHEEIQKNNKNIPGKENVHCDLPADSGYLKKLSCPISIQQQKKRLNDYDRIPEKKKVNPTYERQVVRKKSERKKLEGWDCKDCENWYNNLGLSAEGVKKRKNLSSRHRSKYNPRYETPPGFWNPTFSQPLSSSDEN